MERQRCNGCGAASAAPPLRKRQGSAGESADIDLTGMLGDLDADDGRRRRQSRPRLHRKASTTRSRISEMTRPGVVLQINRPST